MPIKPYPPPRFTSKPGTTFRGLPTITQAGFAAWAAKQPKKPGGRSYEGYRTYLENNRRGKGPTPAAASPRGTTLQSLLGSLHFETPAQLEARANRMAGTQIKSQQAMIREEAKLMRDEAQRRMEAQSAAGRAAAAQNAAMFGMVGGEYNAAAQEMQGLGTNLGATMAGQTAADVARQNQGLAAIGAPGVGEAQSASGPGIGGARQLAVEQFRGATLPKDMIDTSGQAAQFGLAGMVSAQNLRATQEAAAGFQEATYKANTARSAAMKELAAGRPEQAAKFLLALQDAQRQQVGLASGLIQQIRAGQAQKFEQGVTKTKLGMAQAEQTFNQNATLRDLAMKEAAFGASLAEIDLERSMALGYVVDKAGKPVTKNGKKIPAKRLLDATKGAAKGKTLTPGQRLEMIQGAQTFAETAFYGYKNVDGKRVPATQAGDFDPDDPNTYGNGSMQYTQALSRLLQLGMNPAGAQSILNNYYERGDMGRPVFSAPEEKILRRRLGPKKFAWAKAQIANLLGRDAFEAADTLISSVLQGGRDIAWVAK